MTAPRLSHQPALQQLIARPGAGFDPRVGVPVSASPPPSRQAIGRDARVPAYLFVLPHQDCTSVSTVSSHGGLTECGQITGVAGG
jgi:hypothetical protein